MKMYCLFDEIRQRYFRQVVDGRDAFTSKPYDLTSDRKILAAAATRYSKKVNWFRYGYKDEPPHLVIKEFEVTAKE